MQSIGTFFFIINYILIFSNKAKCERIKYFPVVENIELCPENDKLRFPIKNLESKKVNQTHTSFTIEVTFDEDIGEKHGYSIGLERWSPSTGWVNISFLPRQKNICKILTSLDMFKNMWIEILTNAGVEHPDKCPIPAGTYKLKEYIIDIQGITVGNWKGKFRATTKLSDVNFKEVYLCFVTTVSIISAVQ